MGLFDGGAPNYIKDIYKQYGADPDRSVSFSGKTWTCPRCGTVNPKEYIRCDECKNRKPNP
jgi:hypothetical protein